MGAVPSSQTTTDMVIARALNAQRETFARTRTIKLLLYGTGESGKTSILRCMRIHHGDELEEERRLRKPLICYNIIEGGFIASRAARTKYGIEFKDPEVLKAIKILEAAYDRFTKESSATETRLELNVVVALTTIYQSPQFQKMLAEHRSALQVPEGWEWFMTQLISGYGHGWGDDSWIPSKEDLLHSRIRTTGQNSFNFSLEGIKYQLIDVGGQRPERRKFHNIFLDMDAVLYVASLSEYDQMLFEDETTNRLNESLRVWESTVNHRDFTNKWFLFFFNKFDLLQKKYYDEKIPIRFKEPGLGRPPTFDEEQDRDCDLAVAWFRELYMSKVKPNKVNQVRMYVTSALDETSVARAMELCTTLFLNQTDVGSYN